MAGTSLMAIALFTNSSAFHSARYEIGSEWLTLQAEDEAMDPAQIAALRALEGQSFVDVRELNAEVRAKYSEAGLEAPSRNDLTGISNGAMQINSMLVLLAISLFIAGFAISLGPVMWAMFSEIFPANVRALAIAVAGAFNSIVSYLVQQFFPYFMETSGPVIVFAFFGTFSVLALLFSIFIVPETKGRSLEEIEAELIRG